LRLASWLPGRYASYLRWLSHLIDRLGVDRVLALWQEVHQGYDDALLSSILATGWCADEQADIAAAEEHIATLPARFFPEARKDIDQAQARLLAEQMPPVRQIRRAFPSLAVRRETTAYEALHLACDGPALLVEALIRSNGKQGELIAYDIQRAERIEAGGRRSGGVAEFIADFTAQPREASLFAAGLTTEIMHVSEREVVLHVKECEWARYFRERHPQVGYLMACSTDEAAYRAFNPTLRLQRTSTLMEGAPMCDFRIFVVDQPGAQT
jgi:predicted hydrocarbon binding protein